MWVIIVVCDSWWCDMWWCDNAGCLFILLIFVLVVTVYMILLWLILIIFLILELRLIDSVMVSVSLVMICSCCGNGINVIIHIFVVVIFKAIYIVIVIDNILVALLYVLSPYYIIISLFLSSLSLISITNIWLLIIIKLWLNNMLMWRYWLYLALVIMYYYALLILMLITFYLFVIVSRDEDCLTLYGWLLVCCLLLT